MESESDILNYPLDRARPLPPHPSGQRARPIVAIDNGDDLIEEYSGFGLPFETRKLGSERLGASFEWTRFDQDWHGDARREFDSRVLQFAT